MTLACYLVYTILGVRAPHFGNELRKPCHNVEDVRGLLLMR